ncbi:MAG TPA: L-threonylcarbamoyladenylate synthase [Tepidisphaeraceae bacterium]
MTDGEIARAVELLQAGELIGLPTETVYGLAADARSTAAVAKIFALKGRPPGNPLIVHVTDSAMARRYAADWPDTAEKLANAFWPGPLTMVLPKSEAIPSIVTAGGATVGLRSPDHPIAQAVLRAFDGPLAAPSANRSNHVSPTTAAHVRDEFGDALSLVLDGGPCRVGIESTVIDLSSPRPRVLRPGSITIDQLQTALGHEIVSPHPAAPPPAVLKSPGQLPVHYAPQTPAYRYEAQQFNALDLTDAAALPLTLDAEAYARQFYARLRFLDSQNLRALYIELPPATSQWNALRDRILRATKPLP